MTERRLGLYATSRLAAHSGRLVREVITNFPQTAGYWTDDMVTRLRVMVGMWAHRCAQEGYDSATGQRSEQPAGELRGPSDGGHLLGHQKEDRPASGPGATDVDPRARGRDGA